MPGWRRTESSLPWRFVVTDRNSELRTSEFADPSPERETAPQASESPKSEVTYGDIARRAVASTATYFTPPSILTARPESVVELRRYPREGDWLLAKVSPLRTLAVTYWRAIGLPVTVICRYVEWIAQRPGRALLAYVLWRLFTVAGPGRWLVENVGPALGSIGKWLFL
jgi:hypothetical protein